MTNKIPKLFSDRCDLCGACVSICAPDALELYERYLDLKPKLCDYCRKCIVICPMDALEEDDG